MLHNNNTICNKEFNCRFVSTEMTVSGSYLVQYIIETNNKHMKTVDNGHIKSLIVTYTDTPNKVNKCKLINKCE